MKTPTAYFSITAVALIAAMPLASSSCGNRNGGSKQQLQNAIVSQDVKDTLDQLKALRDNEPLPKFNDSAALHVQDAYYTADADPKKLWYVNIVSPYSGAVLEHFDTIGAPQPSGDQVTNPVQQYCSHNKGALPDGCDTIGLPEPNGVHQSTSNDGYVAILTTGAVKRFSCSGVFCDISDQPITSKQKPILTIDETQPITATDVSKTTNPIVPKGTGRRK